MTSTLRSAGVVLAAFLFLASAAAEKPASPVDAFVKKADDLIHDNDYDAKSTAHYRVKTDDPRFDVVAAANLLESFYAFFDAFWKGRAALLPCDEPMRFYLFYSRAKFKQLGVYQERPDGLELVGHYQGYYDLVAMHTDTVAPENFPDALLHEAAHQMIQRRLYGMDNPPSTWVNEGLAEYFGNTLRDASGAFHAGRIGGKSASFYKKTRAAEGKAHWARARAYRRALADGTTVTVDELLRGIDPASFYGQRSLERYTAAWLLAHYLLHADGGAHVPAFVVYMGHDAAGDGGADTFYRDIGMTPDQLASSFARYVDKLDPR